MNDVQPFKLCFKYHSSDIKEQNWPIKDPYQNISEENDNTFGSEKFSRPIEDIVKNVITKKQYVKT